MIDSLYINYLFIIFCVDLIIDVHDRFHKDILKVVE